MKRILLIVALLCARLNVGPELALNQVKNGLAAYTIFLGKLARLALSKFRSYFQYLLRCEFTLRMILTAPEILRSKINALLCSIYLVAMGIAQKQMFGPDALPIVAGVQYPFPAWNLSEVEKPTESMHQNSSIVDRQLAITSISRCSANPKPTAIGFMDKFPELLRGIRARLVVAISAAKLRFGIARGKYALAV